MRLYIDRMLWSRMHLKETISSPWQEKISVGHQTVSGGSSSLPGGSGCPIQVRQVGQPDEAARRSLFAQLDQVSFLQQHSPVLQLDLIPSHPSGKIVPRLTRHLWVQHVPKGVPREKFPWVRMGEEGDLIFLGKRAQLLWHNTTALKVDLNTGRLHR